MSEPRPWWRSLPVLGALVAVVATVAGDFVLASFTATPPDIVLFFGRFHPLAVHLPIGMLVLVGVAELLGLSPRLRARIDPALAIALPLTVASAVGSFLLGHMLAKGGGFPSGTLLLHRRLMMFAVLASALCLAVWTFHARSQHAFSRWLYRGVLGAGLGLLSIGAHFGGSMTRGDAYLAKYAPGPLKALLGGGSETASDPEAAVGVAPGDEPLVYASVVAPILKKYCVECHGPETAKARLRVDSLEDLLKGGENGPAAVPGAGDKSQLVVRLRRPLGDDERMPPEGKAGPSEAEIALLTFWIDRGASAELRVRDTLLPPGARDILENALGGAASPAGPPPAAGTSPAPPSGSSSAPSADPSAAPVSLETDEPLVDQPAGHTSAPPPPAVPVAVVASPLAWDARVAPLLLARCSKCHGAVKPKGKLRVDTVEALLKGGSGGPAVFPGDPGKSPLLAKVRLPLGHRDHMPPKREPQLSDEEIEVLDVWITKGARRDLPASALPGAAVAVVAPVPAPPPSATSVAPAPAPTGTTVAVAPAPPPAPEPEPVHVAIAPRVPVDATVLASLPRHLRIDTVVSDILEDRCGSCHGADSALGDLRIDELSVLAAGGSSGPSLEPGKPAESLLVQRLLLPIDDGDHMPPSDMPQPEPGEIELIEVWIEQGGKPDLVVETKALGLSKLGVAALAPHAAKAKVVLPEELAEGAGGEGAQPPAVHGAGCAACTVVARGDASDPSFAAFGASLAALAALALRRRRA